MWLCVSYISCEHVNSLPAKQMHTRDRFCPALHTCTSPETTFKINSSTLGVFVGKREKSVTPCGRLIIHSAQTLLIDSSLNNYFVRMCVRGRRPWRRVHLTALSIFTPEDRDRYLSSGSFFAFSLCGLGIIRD